MKIKIITGFRKDQKYTIDADEAHKAYYLFMNPDKRGIFNNGVALVGSMIQGIEPDYHATMGWNETHLIDSDDWNELNSKGIAKQLNAILVKAKDVVKEYQDQPEVFSLPLSQVEIKQIASATSFEIKKLSDKFRN